jgi:hypothetical protein
MNLTEFFKKFYELRDTSPRIFSTSMGNENSLYTEALAYSKNCYYVFTGGWDEDCYYGETLVKCKNCVDCIKAEGCELCYQCTDCYQCYNSNFLSDCRSTRDSEYCFGLKDCTNCFLSSNQRKKSFIFKNKQYIKEKYMELVEEYKKTYTPSQLYNEFLLISRNAVRVNLKMINSEDCIGNDISNSKNIYYSFDIVDGQDYLYSEEAGFGKDCCDVYIGGKGELLYECVGVVKNSYNCSFCYGCVTCVNCEFCQSCYNTSDCFACFYLKGKKFHILNVAYKPEVYKKEVDSIKEALFAAGKYNLNLLAS